jgi:hypothetical protein
VVFPEYIQRIIFAGDDEFCEPNLEMLLVLELQEVEECIRAIA